MVLRICTVFYSIHSRGRHTATFRQADCGIASKCAFPFATQQMLALQHEKSVPHIHEAQLLQALVTQQDVMNKPVYYMNYRV